MTPDRTENDKDTRIPNEIFCREKKRGFVAGYKKSVTMGRAIPLGLPEPLARTNGGKTHAASGARG